MQNMFFLLVGRNNEKACAITKDIPKNPFTLLKGQKCIIEILETSHFYKLQPRK